MILNEIWRMQRKYTRLLKSYARLKQKLMRESPAHWGAMMLDEESELSELSLNITIAQSEALKEEAYNLRVPLPSSEDKEVWDDFFGPRILTTKGYAELRSKIRQERKERREMWTTVVKDILTPIGGIIISILSLMIAYSALKLKH